MSGSFCLATPNGLRYPLFAGNSTLNKCVQRGQIACAFKVTKRIAPTVTLSAASHWAYYNANISTFVTWVTISPQASVYGVMFDVSGMAASLPGAGYATLFGPNGTASARMYFDARL